MWKSTEICGSWLTWSLRAAELKVLKQPTLLKVGQWDAAHGLSTYDDWFPHFNGGLRGRIINVTTLEVCFSIDLYNLVFYLKQKKNFFIILKNSFLHGRFTSVITKAM